MSTDVCQVKNAVSTDISWDTLIADTETQIRQAQERMKLLSKSLRSMRKKQQAGVPFPNVKLFREAHTATRGE